MKEENFWILVSKKVTGEATPRELELLAQLLQNDPEKTAVLENIQELWNSKPAETSSGVTQIAEDAYLAHVNRLKSHMADFGGGTSTTFEDFVLAGKRKPFYTRPLSYALVLAAAVLSFLLFPLLKQQAKTTETAATRPVHEIVIKPGLKTKIQLPDGSQVWVNSGSKLSYEGNFDGNKREVRLNGEAFFDVVKDASRPFIVHTSGIDIKVLGTAFNVKAYDQEPTIEATLIRGSIEVLNKNQPGNPKVMLKPHEKLVYSKYAVNGTVYRQPASIQNADANSITIKPINKNIADSDIVETSWVYNKLAFEDERFEDLASKMERWYNLKIQIHDEKLKNYRISGSFVNETAEEALTELQLLVSFRYTIKNNEINIDVK